MIPLKLVKKFKAEIKSCNTSGIKAYNGGTIKVLGETKIMVSTIKQKENVEKLITFNVIDEDHQAILGGDDCENLGFVKRVNQLGCCKNFEYDIDFIDNPNFKIIPARKVPYAIQSKVKDEITKMIDMGVIKKVNEPTPAVSPMLVVTKGKIRVCMDPTELNKNIKRRIYPMKTVEEIIAKAHGSKYFTKLDCQKGFWQIKVTERTSKYLTFSTPWGRFSYLRLPFGISSAPEIFCAVMNQTLEGISGCEVAMDDIFIHAKTKAELNKRTHEVTKRLQDAGFTLNEEKCEYGKTSIKFLGFIFNQTGCAADEDNKIIKSTDLCQRNAAFVGHGELSR